MAQGAAWCARARGVPCTVIAPDTAPATKLRAIERLGGKVFLEPFDRWWQAFEERTYPGVDGAHEETDTVARLFVPLKLRHRRLGNLAFFSTIATFGTALDLTMAELAIESFFPADPATAEALRAA